MSADYTSFPVPTRQFAAPVGQHASLGRSLRGIIWLVVMAIIAAVLYFTADRALFIPLLVICGIIVYVLVAGIRVAAQWERGIVLRLGRFLGIKGPGIMYIIPFVEYVRFVDMRVLTLNIPSQRVITKDNVPAMIDGVLFFIVADPEKAVINIQDFQFAIAQYAQAALRDIVGNLTLDELLTEREHIQNRIGEIVEEHVKEWGLHIDSIRLLDINLPEDLQRMMSRQAAAEREKRANITKSEGDKLAANNLADAAHTMAASPGAMQLRSLQTIDGLGPSASNTVVLFPVEWVQFLQSMQKINQPGE